MGRGLNNAHAPKTIPGKSSTPKGRSGLVRLVGRGSSRFLTGLSLSVFLVLTEAARLDAAPLSYSGRLTDSGGAPFEGNVTLTLRFYHQESGGNPVGVPVELGQIPLVDGVFQVNFNLPEDQFRVIFEDFFKQVFVEVESQGTIFPRQRYLPVPLALRIPVNENQLFFNAEGKLSISSIGVTQIDGLSALLDTKANSSDLSAIGSTQITDGSLKNEDIAANAAIADAKLAPISTPGKVLGNAVTSGTLGGTSSFAGSGGIDTSGAIQGSGNIILKPSGGQPTELQFQASGSSTYVGLKAPMGVTASKVWTLPAADGSSGQVLTTNGSGGLQWSSPGGGGDLLSTANLSELTSPLDARTNLGLGSLATLSTITDSEISPTAEIALSKVAGLSTALAGKEPTITASTVLDAGRLTTSLQNGVELLPYGTGAGNTGELRLKELAAGGTDYVGFKAPDAITTPRIWTLPAADGGSGQVLSTNGSGILSWVSPGNNGTVTSVGLTAPTAGISVSGGPITTNGSIALSLADDLAALEALSTTGAVERTAPNTWSTYAVTAAGKALLADADTTAQRTTLGLGALATAGAVSGGNGGTITDGTITNDDISTGAAIAQSKIFGLTSALTAKEPTISEGTDTQYYRGDKTWQSLQTDVIAEGTYNRFFTEARARAALSSGGAPLSYVSSTGVISITQASTSSPGFLSAADFSAFNDKQNSISTSSTLNAGTLTSTAQKGVQLNPFGIAGGNTGELRMAELAAGGSEYVGFKAPDAITASKIWTLPSADGSANQVLSTNGGGLLSWMSIPSAPVTSVAGKTGDIALSTTDITSGTLGVARGGTGLATVPTDGQVLIGNGSGYSLGTITAGTNISVTNGPGAITINAPSDTTKVSKAGDTMTGILNLPADGLVVGTNQLAVVSGKVGIGTTTPQAALEVAGGTTADGQLHIGSEGQGGRIVFSRGTDGGHHGQIGWGSATTAQDFDFSNFSGSGYFKWTLNSAGVGTGERMRLNNAGNLGIGTTNPTAKLQVNGQIANVLPTPMAPMGAAQTIDWSAGNVQAISLASATGNVAITLNNGVAGALYMLHVTQGTTIRNLTWGANVKWPKGVPPVVTITAGAEDVFTFFYNGTNFYGTYGQDYR